MMWDTLVAAFFLGLLGAGHCLGMCGGIAAALSFALPANKTPQKLAFLAAYNAGRIASYTFIGLVAGLVGWWLGQVAGAVYLRIFAGVLLILLGLYLADWWRLLGLLEKSGAGLWAKIQPIGNRLLPVKTVPQAALLGLIWGWLPCGLIYSALGFALASSNSNALYGASIMLAFGLGTLPAVFTGGLAAEKILALFKLRNVRIGFALCYIVFGVWTVYIAIQHAGHSHHATSEHAAHNHVHAEKTDSQLAPEEGQLNNDDNTHNNSQENPQHPQHHSHHH
ncbi:sulfite exporter TauE/SafE family protein [Saccharophagus degradans]|nr:sulfite exporter TauE/SafE family protein [Saccharophagus degradans]